MENSAIEWTDHTFNPWEGCTKVSPGCANCYAATRNARWNGGTALNWGKGAPRRRTSKAYWRWPLTWNREEERQRFSALRSWPAGKPMPWTRPRVFCASLADWLDDEVPIEWLADLLDLIRLTPNLDWLLLTKRPENFHRRLQTVLDFIPTTGIDIQWAALRARVQVMLCGWEASIYTTLELGIQNYWIGTTVENQAMADKRIPELRRIPAKVRFLSCEPLLEPLDLRTWLGKDRPDPIHWIIAGGESGPGCRAFDPDWARSLRDECAASGVPFFMKQMGGTRKPFAPIPADLQIRQFPSPC
jgi:protein gp37